MSRAETARHHPGRLAAGRHRRVRHDAHQPDASAAEHESQPALAARSALDTCHVADAAEAAGVEAFVTRNARDFAQARLPVLAPAEALARPGAP